jgi:hypothetical protein
MDIKRATRFEVVIVICGFLALFTSIVFAIKLNDMSWFSRSGSLMVLCAIIAEYSNLRVQQFINQRATSGAGAIGGGISSLLQSKFRRFWSYITHFEVIFGTLIWGYGDLAYDCND